MSLPAFACICLISLASACLCLPHLRICTLRFALRKHNKYTKEEKKNILHLNVESLLSPLVSISIVCLFSHLRPSNRNHYHTKGFSFVDNLSILPFASVASLIAIIFGPSVHSSHSHIFLCRRRLICRSHFTIQSKLHIILFPPNPYF